MKIIDIISAKGLLQKISECKDIPTRLAYNIYILLNSLNATLDFYDEQKKKVFEEYGVREGDNIIIPEDKIEEVEPILNELVSVEIDDPPKKVDVSLDINLGISPADINLLVPFINFID